MYRHLTTVDEAGICATASVEVTVNDSGQFVANLPSYVAIHQECEGLIICDRLTDLIETYEDACDQYSKWRLMVKVTPMLFVSASSQFDAAPHGIVLRLSWFPVVVHTADTGELTVIVLDDAGKYLRALSPELGRLIDDTPEHREKIQALVDSVKTASGLLNDFNACSNPAEFLMAIGDDWTPRHSGGVVSSPDQFGLFGDRPSEQTVEVEVTPQDTVVEGAKAVDAALEQAAADGQKKPRGRAAKPAAPPPAAPASTDYEEF